MRTPGRRRSDAMVPGTHRRAPGGARAQAYPAKPVTMIIPFALGGSTDVVGRILAEGMRGPLGQPVFVENVTGGAGSVGVGRLAMAPPDGYTIDIGQWDSHVVTRLFYKLPYDLLNDFAPIALLASTPSLILTRRALPADDLQGFIRWLKANPTATYAYVGAGRQARGILLQKETGARFASLQYEAMAAVMQDLVAGRIDFTIAMPALGFPPVRAGEIKAVAVMAERRVAVAPDIPTVDEAGLPGFYMSEWFGLFAPRDTPKHAIATLNAAAMAAMANPTVRARLADLALEIFPREQQTPEALGLLLNAEHDHIAGAFSDVAALALSARGDPTTMARLRGPRAARLRSILAEIKAGYTNPACSPRQVGKKLGLSRRYIQDLLQESGTSFTAQVLKLRLQRSRAMLASPRYDRYKVIEIAHRCGFNEVSHFNRCFRRSFGLSPTEFRTGTPRGSA